MVQYSHLDTSFAALSDPTRRGILEHLTGGRAPVGDLAVRFEMSIPGITKHIRLLEEAGLVVTEKKDRVRYCTIGANPLDREAAWIRDHRQVLEERLDRLGAFLDRTKEPS